jgi:2,5-diketo-D-gluconate reductase B
MDTIPQFGLGTWRLRGMEGQKAVENALEIGYRHIDTADYYQNHDIVGRAIKNSGLKREDIYLVTKIMPPLTSNKIAQAGPRFLKELQVDYIDLLLVHWPDSNPITEVLENFQKLQNAGITKKIGVSNFSLSQMKEGTIKGFDIYNHQFEIYPGNFDKKLVSYCQNNNIGITSYSPFAQGRMFKDQKIIKLAEEVGIKPSPMILSWLLSKNIVVIPKATGREHLMENFEAQNTKLPQETIAKLDNF